MSRTMKCIYGILTLAIAISAQGQQAPSAASLRDSGLYEYSSFGTGHDSSAGWSAVLNSAVGYDFTRHFALELGVPYYLVSSSLTTTTTRTGSLGDVFMRARATAHSAALDYGTAVTVTAPTGDTSSGISTGRVTFTWDNRLEHGFSRITPFGEGSIGNTLMPSTRYMRSYTTLGAASEFRGGAGLDLFKYTSLEGSVYGDLGFGNQKIFSHSVPKGLTSASSTASKHGRPFEAAYVTTGTGSLVNDHGVTADLSLNPVPRVGVDLAYNHSIPFDIDTFSLTLGVRFGHLPKPSSSR